MPRAKRKATPQPIGDHVDQIRAGEGFTDARVVMMPGETQRVALNTRRRACPALRWGWLSVEQRAMLVLFAQAADDAGYGTVRSALCEPTGEGMGNSAERRFARRQRYAAMRNACRDQAAMILTCEALDPPDRETFDQTAMRLSGMNAKLQRRFGDPSGAVSMSEVVAWADASRDYARRYARHMISVTADDLLAWKVLGERNVA